MRAYTVSVCPLCTRSYVWFFSHFFFLFFFLFYFIQSSGKTVNHRSTWTKFDHVHTTVSIIIQNAYQRRINELFLEVRFLPRLTGSSDFNVVRTFPYDPWQKRWIDPCARSIFRGCLRSYEFCFSSFLPWYKTRWKILRFAAQSDSTRQNQIVESLFVGDCVKWRGNKGQGAKSQSVR